MDDVSEPQGEKAEPAPAAGPKRTNWRRLVLLAGYEAWTMIVFVAIVLKYPPRNGKEAWFTIGMTLVALAIGYLAYRLHMFRQRLRWESKSGFWLGI